MTTKTFHFSTDAEYLAFERLEEWKHEYIDGVAVGMPPVNRNHVRIVGNLLVSLATQVRNTERDVLASRIRIKVAATGLFTYPDVLVSSNQNEFLDEADQDTLLNPAVIIEVVSPASETYDRGEKFENYKSLESLQEYLLASQKEKRIEHFVRQADGSWHYTDTKSAEAVIKLPSIDCELKLTDVYDKVTFDVPSPGGFMREQLR